MKTKITKLALKKQAIACLSKSQHNEAHGGRSVNIECNSIIYCPPNQFTFIDRTYEFKITDWENHFRFDFRQTWRP